MLSIIFILKYYEAVAAVKVIAALLFVAHY